MQTDDRRLTDGNVKVTRLQLNNGRQQFVDENRSHADYPVIGPDLAAKAQRRLRRWSVAQLPLARRDALSLIALSRHSVSGQRFMRIRRENRTK